MKPKADEQMRRLIDEPGRSLCASAKITALREVQAFIESNRLACASIYDFIELRISSYLTGDLD